LNIQRINVLYELPKRALNIEKISLCNISVKKNASLKKRFVSRWFEFVSRCIRMSETSAVPIRGNAAGNSVNRLNSYVLS